MSSAKTKTSFKSETLQVLCRVCRKSVLNKNYKDHLKNMHPNEDHSDLRPHGQTMLDLSSWAIPRNKRDRSSLDNESESEVEEEGNASREKNPRRPSEGSEVNRVVPNDYEMECDEYTNSVRQYGNS